MNCFRLALAGLTSNSDDFSPFFARSRSKLSISVSRKGQICVKQYKICIRQIGIGGALYLPTDNLTVMISIFNNHAVNRKREDKNNNNR